MTIAQTAPATLADLSGEYVIDPAHTRIGFVARHAMVTKVRGAFNEFEGRFTADGANPSRSSASVTIQAASIDTRNADRDGHLRSNDFFDMETYPEITFVSTAVEQSDGEQFRVTGDLTIKGVSRPVRLQVEYLGHATDPWGNDRAVFSAVGKLNREDWGLTWNMLLETGGLLVSKDITLELEVELIRQ